MIDIGKIDIDCPDCGATLWVSLSDVASQKTVTCPRGHRVELVDDGGGARQVDQSMRDLDRALNRLAGH